MTYVHTIQDSEFKLASELAEETVQVFSGRPGFYNNNINSHLRGKVGEIAVSSFLDSAGIKVTNLWSDIGRMAEADILVPSKLRADVKTWDVRYWTEMGRCIAAGQVSRLRNKAEAVIWCTSDSRLAPQMNVTVVGWNTMEDIADAPRRLTGPANGRQVDNFQVEMTAVRNLEALLRLLERP